MKLACCAVLIFLTQAAFASGAHGPDIEVESGNIVFVDSKDISIESENLSFVLDLEYSAINVEYVYKYNGKQVKTLDYAFLTGGFEPNPFDDFYENEEGNVEDDSRFVRDFVITQNGKKLAYEKVLDVGRQHFEGYEPHKIYLSYYTTQLKFKAGETIRVQVSYKIKNTYDANSTQRPILQSILYYLYPARGFEKSQIKKLDVNIDGRKIIESKDKIVEYSEELGIKEVQKGMYRLSAKNFELNDRNEVLRIAFTYDNAYLLEMVRTKKKSIELSLESESGSPADDEEEIKSLHSINDGDFNTGSAFRALGPEKSLAFDLETQTLEKDDRLRNCASQQIIFINGNRQTEKAYYEHGRVKRLRVTMDPGTDYSQSFEIEIADQPFAKVSLSNFVDVAVKLMDGNIPWGRNYFGSRLFTFVVLETYPGTKYDDCAISEIMLLGSNMYYP